MMFQVLNASSQKIVKDILMAHQQDMDASSEAAMSEERSLSKRKRAERGESLQAASKERSSRISAAQKFAKRR